MSTKAEVAKLLDKLISGSVSLAEAKELASKAKESIAGEGAAGARSSKRSAPNEATASGQIDKLDAIKYAADSGLINDQQKRDAAAGVLGGEPLSQNGAGTGGGGTAGTIAGSSPSAALPLITAFATGKGVQSMEARSSDRRRPTVRALVTDPSKVTQAWLNLCGPAAFVRVWAERDPVAFAQFSINLFERARATARLGPTLSGPTPTHCSARATPICRNSTQGAPAASRLDDPRLSSRLRELPLRLRRKARGKRFRDYVSPGRSKNGSSRRVLTPGSATRRTSSSPRVWITPSR